MNHLINITNYKANETISHPLIIIKGEIITIKNNKCCETQKTTNLINVKVTNSLVTTTVGNEFKVIVESANKSKFKILIELTDKDGGRNDITLDYCCSSTQISLNYQRSAADCTVQPLYIICHDHDGKFQAPHHEDNSPDSACRRIALGSKLLQAIVSEKFYEANLSRKTFQLEMSTDSATIFVSDLDCFEAKRMSQTSLWEYFGREIMSNQKFSGENRKYLAFLSCTEYAGDKYTSETIKTHEDVIKITDGYVALGGGGLALFGTACLFTWPEYVEEIVKRTEDSTVVDKTKFMDDSCYRGTYSSCFSTTLGSVLHELCHTFDLGHTEQGIMGRGFDEICRALTVNVDEPSMSTVFDKSVEFQENIDTGRLSERLEARPKNMAIKTNSKNENDGTFWTKSGLMLLYYHKWFNNFGRSGSINSSLRFDASTKFVTSTAGLRVIEIRNESDEMVRKFWIFDKRILKFSFQLPVDDDACWGDIFGDDVRKLLVVEDNRGNLIKELLLR